MILWFCVSCKSSGRSHLPKLTSSHLLGWYKRGWHWRQTCLCGCCCDSSSWVRRECRSNAMLLMRGWGGVRAKLREVGETKSLKLRNVLGQQNTSLWYCRLRPCTSTCFFLWISSTPGSFSKTKCCSEIRASSIRLLEELQFWREIASYFCSPMWWMNAFSIRSLELPFLPLGKKNVNCKWKPQVSGRWGE